MAPNISYRRCCLAATYELLEACPCGSENRHERSYARRYPPPPPYPLCGGLPQGHLPPLEPGRVRDHERYRVQARRGSAIRERYGETVVRHGSDRACPLPRRAAHRAGAPRGAPDDPPPSDPRAVSDPTARLRLGRRPRG